MRPYCEECKTFPGGMHLPGCSQDRLPVRRLSVLRVNLPAFVCFPAACALAALFSGSWLSGATSLPVAVAGGLWTGCLASRRQRR